MVDKNESLAKISKTLILEQPFYGLFLISLNKVWRNDLPTAGVSISGINQQLAINPEFWGNLNDDVKKGVLIHELMHIAFNHLVTRDNYQDKKLFNIAADLEINQYIDEDWLPENGIFLDTFPELDLPERAGTDKYYKLLQQAHEDGTSPQLDEMLSEDDFHFTWGEGIDSLTDAEKKLIQKQVEHQLKDVVEGIKDRGNIPGHFRELINNIFHQEPAKFDWKGYLRRFAGNSNKIYTKKTRRKPNKRYDGNPALKIKMRNHVLLAVDTSASVSSSELQEFLSEMNHIHKTGTEITVVQCDTHMHDPEAFNPKKEFKVKGRGGTDFQPVIDHYNKNSKKYTSIIYFTDGECSSPNNVRCKILWVHSSKCTINQDLPGFKIQLN
jgi:predicted metal-dependent peptidase